jgi:hypothetical protein
MYHNFAGFGVFTSEQFEFVGGYVHIFGNTIYKAMNGGSWLDNEECFHQNILADNGAATHSLHSSMTANLIVGDTANQLDLTGKIDGPTLRRAFGTGPTTSNASSFSTYTLASNSATPLPQFSFRRRLGTERV